MPNSLKKILQAAHSGALVLTANKRLYRHLSSAYDQWMQESGVKVWSPPAIHSYDSWLVECLHELGEGWSLLQPQQERSLWEDEISAAERGSTFELLQLAQTAEKARQAHQLLNAYGIVPEVRDATPDQRTFLRWRQAYQQRCREQDWIDKSDLPGKIALAVSDGALALPEDLLLVGFDQYPPGLDQLQQVAREQGVNCIALMPCVDRQADIIRFAAPHTEAELLAAACWTRRLLLQGAERIGIVVPDLARQRRRIERIFRAQIDPQADLLVEDRDEGFSLSLGGPLAEQGVVHAALELLAFSLLPSVEELSFLLRTPYVGGSVREADARALLDARLRGCGRRNLDLSGLIGVVQKNPALSAVAEILADVREQAQNRGKHSPATWAGMFSENLHQLGWPGERRIHSHEYQAVKSWQTHVLEGLAGLDAVLPPISRGRAFGLLRRLARETEFQLEGATGRVQIVGVLESSGLTFQHLWVMGLGEHALPARPQPNPFIPLQVQREYRMPRSSAERELEFAEQVIDRLSKAAPNIVFSYPLRDGDSDLRPSPLITACGTPGLPPCAPRVDLQTALQKARPDLDGIADWRGPGLERTLVSGGTGLLKDQAHCPFRAFVHQRLGCRALEEAAPGVSAMERGDLVHLALEKIWGKLKTQQNLLALGEDEIGTLVREQVEMVFSRSFQGLFAPPEMFLRVEKERTIRLLEDWLHAVEMSRGSFTVVRLEEKLETAIGPLTIKYKVDRVDRLDNGALIVIDYKTGQDLRTQDLLSVPLLEPQLPLYALSGPEGNADTVAYAQIRRGHCRFIGLTRMADGGRGVKGVDQFPQAQELGIEGWTDLLAFWRDQLDNLAADFQRGEAAVEPFSQERSCRYCDLHGLCRIHEHSGLEED